MIVKPYFSYIRVSTVKQGQTGTSLTEQRSAIERYAERCGFTIAREYEEKETAAKLGRPVFNDMLKALKAGKAKGAIIHKIDRSARNLQDWVQLQELIDSGIEVHFANESIDLQSRGGRLSADIQAVVAADYIRNLREETKKGFYGRLKQGLYPRPAPLGYRDCGKGQPKAIDQVNGSLVRQAFELYATGHWPLKPLRKHLDQLGLKNKSGKMITLGALAKLLHNPFYYGLIRLRISGETYAGQHEPLITRQLFERVQDAFQGKRVEYRTARQFQWRKLITCSACNTKLIGERQKIYNYYRCHTKGCPQKSLREEMIEAEFKATLKMLRFSDSENEIVRAEIKTAYANVEALAASQTKALQLGLEGIQSRLSKLADLYIDGMVEKETYLNKKASLIGQEQEAKEKLKHVDGGTQQALKKVEEFVELVNNACLSYELATPEEKRELIKIITSNFSAEGKSLSVKLNYPFKMVAERGGFSCGGPHRATGRTLLALLRELTEYFTERQAMAA